MDLQLLLAVRSFDAFGNICFFDNCHKVILLDLCLEVSIIAWQLLSLSTCFFYCNLEFGAAAIFDLRQTNEQYAIVELCRCVPNADRPSQRNDPAESAHSFVRNKDAK